MIASDYFGCDNVVYSDEELDNIKRIWRREMSEEIIDMINNTLCEQWDKWKLINLIMLRYS